MDAITIHLDAPGKNALGTDHMRRLLAELAAADGRPVLLTGANDCFSAGLNLMEVASLEPDGMAVFLGLLEELVVTFFEYPGPMVAAVNGHAIAGGAVMALACDHTVCTNNDRVRIGLNEVANGLRFPPQTLRVIRARIPAHRHGQVLLGGALHAPQDALALGLVDELADDPLDVATTRLAALARNPGHAYAATKADLRGGVADVDEATAREFIERTVPAWTSDELKARLRAVLKR